MTLTAKTARDTSALTIALGRTQKRNTLDAIHENQTVNPQDLKILPVFHREPSIVHQTDLRRSTLKYNLPDELQSYDSTGWPLSHDELPHDSSPPSAGSSSLEVVIPGCLKSTSEPTWPLSPEIGALCFVDYQDLDSETPCTEASSAAPYRQPPVSPTGEHLEDARATNNNMDLYCDSEPLTTIHRSATNYRSWASVAPVPDTIQLEGNACTIPDFAWMDVTDAFHLTNVAASRSATHGKEDAPREAFEEMQQSLACSGHIRNRHPHILASMLDCDYCEFKARTKGELR